MNSEKKYWFRPVQVWRYFAAYYPISWEGWAVLFCALGYLMVSFQNIDTLSHSVSDTLIGFSPHLVGVLIVLDVITRMTGEWPAWWSQSGYTIGWRD